MLLKRGGGWGSKTTGRRVERSDGFPQFKKGWEKKTRADDANGGVFYDSVYRTGSNSLFNRGNIKLGIWGGIYISLSLHVKDEWNGFGSVAPAVLHTGPGRSSETWASLDGGDDVLD